MEEYSDQPWGNTRGYKIDHYSNTTWCASVNDELKLCKIVRVAPTDMLARSEIHSSLKNELDTQFSSVYYRTSDGLWHYFDQELWNDDCPYLVDKDLPYYFHTFSGYCISMPIVNK